MRSHRFTFWLRSALFAWSSVCLTMAFETRAENVSSQSVGREPLHQTLVPPGVTVEMTPQEVQLFAAASAGRLNGRTLWRAALVASGVSDSARLTDGQQKLDTWCEELHGLLPESGNDRERARVVFEFMHRQILTGEYDALCSDVTLIEEEGRYNCISSSILFQSLAERVGLRSAGGEVPGHAFCWLWVDGDRVALETTNPHWFVNSPSPTQSVAASRELSAAQMTAMIYYNRGFLLLREGQFAAAIAANAKALRLDSASDVSRDNLLAALNNWALDRCAHGEFEFAEELLQHGLRVAPHHRPFQINLEVVRQRADEMRGGTRIITNLR